MKIDKIDASSRVHVKSTQRSFKASNKCVDTAIRGQK